MKYRLFAVAACAFLAISGIRAQENANFNKFQAMLEQKDTIGMKNILADWDHNDPEYYVCEFNYQLFLSRQQFITIDKLMAENKEESIPLYDETYLNKAISALEEGIAKYPDRLDMRCGLITVLINEAKETDKALEVIASTLERNKENLNTWLWAQGEPAGPDTLEDSIQDYFSEIELTKDQNALADLVIQYFPQNPVFLNDKASCLWNSWEFEEALKLYEEAYAYDKTDMLIAGNLAYGYAELNKYEEAKKYLEIIKEQSQDPGQIGWAQGSLDRIKELQSTEFKKVDINELKRFVTENRAGYDNLLDRFNNADTTLTHDKSFLLYCATAFTEYATNRVDIWDLLDSFDDMRPAQIYEVVKTQLKKYPLSLRLLYLAYSLADNLKDPEENNHLSRFLTIFEAIVENGNGCSEDCPLIVTNMDDEYFLLGQMGMSQLHSQAAVTAKDGSRILDMMDFMADNGAKRRYFDVSILFYLYSKLFDKQ